MPVENAPEETSNPRVSVTASCSYSYNPVFGKKLRVVCGDRKSVELSPSKVQFCFQRTAIGTP